MPATQPALFTPNATLGTVSRLIVFPDMKKACGMMLGSGFEPNRFVTLAAGLLEK